jgi:hypothetical protein
MIGGTEKFDSLATDIDEMDNFHFLHFTLGILGLVS